MNKFKNPDKPITDPSESDNLGSMTAPDICKSLKKYLKENLQKLGQIELNQVIQNIREKCLELFQPVCEKYRTKKLKNKVQDILNYAQKNDIDSETLTKMINAIQAFIGGKKTNQPDSEIDDYCKHSQQRRPYDLNQTAITLFLKEKI